MNTIEKDRAYLVQCYTTDPVVFTHGKGVCLYDENGKEYLDFSGQFSSDSLGHGNEEMIQAITDQMRKITNVTSCFPTEERASLAEKMVAITPDGLDYVMFGCTGSDANEFALKAAKYYQGGGKIISFRRGFHGSTAGSAAATGKSETIQESASISELLPGGFVHSAAPYCYRCDFGRTQGECGMECLHYLEQTILQEGGEKVAAIITEPVFAAGGVIVPPKGFLKGVRELCDKYHILLIFDEVVTGLGQTGTMFACEYEGVTPDILVTGKALTSGYIPGSAVVMRREIGEAMSKISLHGHTHSCYPLAMRAALKNIEMINTVLSENKDITIRVDVRQEFSLDSRAMQKFRTVITMQRQRMIADINALIKRYDLELDEDEERIIRDDAILPKEKHEEPEEKVETTQPEDSAETDSDEDVEEDAAETEQNFFDDI